MTLVMSKEYLAGERDVPDVPAAERSVAVTGGGYFPVLNKLTNGSIAAVLRGGAPHVGIEGRLDYVHSEDGGKTWSEPSVIVDSPWDDRNPAFGQMQDGTLVVAYLEYTHYDANGHFDANYDGPASGAFFVTSTDNGKTWSQKHGLASPLHGASPYGKIITLPDGTALMAVYGPADTDSPVSVGAILRSTDNGRTWGDGSVIARGANETSVVAMPDGRLLAFMRTESPEAGDGVGICQAESHDLGRTWSEPTRLTGLQQHPADACLLKSGNLLLTYGNRVGELAVGAMLSRDRGKTWDRDRRMVLARESLTLRGKPWGDCGYPSTVQLADGTIVTLYYRLGTNQLPEAEQERCRQYERDTFDNPPASDDMRRFEEAICVRYTEAQLC